MKRQESTLAAGMLRYLRTHLPPPQQQPLPQPAAPPPWPAMQPSAAPPPQYTGASSDKESPAPPVESSEKQMSAKFYRCLRAGNLESLDPTKLQNPLLRIAKGFGLPWRQPASSVSQDEENRFKEEIGGLLGQLTPQHNTPLHIVALQGFDKLITDILNLHPDLVTKQNKNQELALHLAAGAGRLAAVEAILNFVQEEPKRESLCTTHNKHGETPLHVAVRNKHISVASSLVNFHPKASFCLDQTEDSPFCLAAESGELELIKDMIRDSNPDEVQNHLQGWKSIVHAAILGGNSGYP